MVEIVADCRELRNLTSNHMAGLRPAMLVPAHRNRIELPVLQVRAELPWLVLRSGMK